MILDEYVEVAIVPFNYKYYADLGYFIPPYHNKNGDCKFKRGTKIKVKPLDLPSGSKIKIRIKCDFCGEERCVEYCQYIDQIHHFGDYACGKCRYQHTKITNMKIYGVENPQQVEEFKQKSVETCVQKYGVSNPMQSSEIVKNSQRTNTSRYGVPAPLQNEEIKNKVKQTNLKKYGCENVSQNTEIRNKINKTYFKNNSQKISFQQMYIYSLISQKYKVYLNYPFKGYSLDIFLSTYKVDIEVDGGGHTLAVKIGNMTQEQFNKKEIQREAIIRKSGIKIIRIIMPTDKLPTDETIMSLIEAGLEYFNKTNHTWINYYVEDGYLKNAEHIDGLDYEYGVLTNSSKLKKQLQRKEVV